MKIVFVLENYIPHIGGVEVVFKNLCEGLAELGHDISIVTHRIKGTPRHELINNVKVYRVNCLGSRYLFTFLAVPKIMKIAKKADLIHTTTFNGAPPAWLAAKLLGKKVVITIHEVWIGKWKKLTEMGWLKSLVHDILERMIYTLSFDKYVCVSKSTRKQLIDVGIAKDKSVTVYNGLDYKQWNPISYDREKYRKKLKAGKDFIYMFTGRPGVSKGLEYLIKAVPKITDSIPNARLIAIVSRDRAYKKRYDMIVNLIKKLGVKDKVVLHDPVAYDLLPNYIKAADCVVVPSLAEGFGFAAAEACAMKKVVIASNTTSLPEVVSGKFLLVGPRNPDSIASGVISAAKGKINKSKLTKFSLKDNIANYLKVYKRLKK